MPSYYGSDKSSRVWQSLDVDNHGEVSSLLMKAYTVSLLLLALVLVWTMGDAWMHYGSPSLPDSNEYSNFTVLDFAQGK
jgi:hypothetical protein